MCQATKPSASNSSRAKPWLDEARELLQRAGAHLVAPHADRHGPAQLVEVEVAVGVDGVHRLDHPGDRLLSRVGVDAHGGHGVRAQGDVGAQLGLELLEHVAGQLARRLEGEGDVMVAHEGGTLPAIGSRVPAPAPSAASTWASSRPATRRSVPPARRAISGGGGASRRARRSSSPPGGCSARPMARRTPRRRRGGPRSLRPGADLVVSATVAGGRWTSAESSGRSGSSRGSRRLPGARVEVADVCSCPPRRPCRATTRSRPPGGVNAGSARSRRGRTSATSAAWPCRAACGPTACPSA